MEQIREPSREQSRGSSRGSSSRQSRTWSSARMTVSRSSRSTMSVVSDSEGAVLSDSGGRGGPPAARSMDTCALRSMVSSRKMVASFSAFLAFTCGGDGNQTSSDAIKRQTRGNQEAHSRGALKAAFRRTNQPPSDAIRHEQTSSEAIRRHQTSSHLGEHSEAGLGPSAMREAISMQSDAITPRRAQRGWPRPTRGTRYALAAPVSFAGSAPQMPRSSTRAHASSRQARTGTTRAHPPSAATSQLGSSEVIRGNQSSDWYDASSSSERCGEPIRGRQR